MDASVTQPLGTPAKRQPPTNTKALGWPYGAHAFPVAEPPQAAAPVAPQPAPVPAPLPATPREPFKPLHGDSCGCAVCKHERYFGEPIWPREELPPIQPKHDWQQVAPDMFYDRVTGTYTRI